MKISSNLKIVKTNYNIKAERILYSNGYLYLSTIKEIDPFLFLNFLIYVFNIILHITRLRL